MAINWQCICTALPQRSAATVSNLAEKATDVIGVRKKAERLEIKLQSP